MPPPLHRSRRRSASESTPDNTNDLESDRWVGPMSAETWKRNHEGGLLQTSVIAASKTEHIRELLPCQRTATSRVVQLRSWQKTCEKGTGRGTSWNRTMPSLWHPSSRRTASEHAPDPSALHQAPCQLSSSSTSAVRHRCLSAPTSGYVDLPLPHDSSQLELDR